MLKEIKKVGGNEKTNVFGHGQYYKHMDMDTAKIGRNRKCKETENGKKQKMQSNAKQ